jgi:superfamily I DNA/RNA helicase
VHRAKGLDFQAVLAVAFSSEVEVNSASACEARELRTRQYLVAASRARDYLWWAVVDGTQSG